MQKLLINSGTNLDVNMIVTSDVNKTFFQDHHSIKPYFLSLRCFETKTVILRCTSATDRT